MQQAFNQLLEFLQQGITAIFHFVRMIWAWSVGQITTLLAVPWQQWPLWKQILLVAVLAAVIWALYRVARELFIAGERILAAFASLLSVLVHTLPSVLLAGVIALGGVWLMNHLSNEPIHLQAYNPFSSSSAPTAGANNPSAPPASGNAAPAAGAGTSNPPATTGSVPAPESPAGTGR